MAPFTKGIAYLCSVELLVTYQSVCAFQVDLSLVDVAIADTCFELEVKLSVQLFWPSEPAIWSIISKRAPKLIAQGETETHCRASELGSSLDDSASDLAFASFGNTRVGKVLHSIRRSWFTGISKKLAWDATSTCRPGYLGSLFLSYATCQCMMECHGILEALMVAEFKPLLGGKQCFAGAVV
jgi:hypothetical protein